MDPQYPSPDSTQPNPNENYSGYQSGYMGYQNPTPSTMPVGESFWLAAFKRYGIGIVFAVMLVGFYLTEQHKWEVMLESDQKKEDESKLSEQKKWEQLFQQYVTDGQRSLETIRECCYNSRSRNAGGSQNE